MNKLKAIFGVLLSVLPSSSVFAQGGSGTGNGGDSVVCRDSNNKIISAVAFDVYEAKLRRNIDLVINTGLSRDAVVMKFIERVAVRSPLRAVEFRDWMTNFDQQVLWLRDQDLVDIPDSGHLSYPSGCKVEQLIIQTEPKFPEDLRYTVNAEIWDKLTPEHQAVMIVHELFIREFKQGKDDLFDTTELRYLNSLIFSDKISALSSDQWLNALMLTQKLEYVEVAGVNGRVLKDDFVKQDNHFLFLLPKKSYSKRYQYFINGYDGVFIHQSYTQYREDRIAVLPEINGAKLFGWNNVEKRIPSRGTLYINFGPLLLSLATHGIDPVQLEMPDANGDFKISGMQYYNLWCPECDIGQPYGNQGIYFQGEGLDRVDVTLNKNFAFKARVKAFGPIRSGNSLNLLGRKWIDSGTIANGFTVDVNFENKTYTISYP